MKRHFAFMFTLGLVATMIAASAPAYTHAGVPVRDAQWHLRFLNINDAHLYSQGAGITVAVVDTGVDATHPDLAGSLVVGTDLTFNAPGDGGQDTDGHGTAMAGLIAAHGQALGIAPMARIQPVRFVAGSLIPGSARDAISWAIGKGAAVICVANVEPDEPDLHRTIDTALAADVVIVAAVGNLPFAHGTQYPAGYPGVLAVAGVDENGNHADFSVKGPEVVLAAPAVHILSTDSLSDGDGEDYRTATGTSDATAIVAGAVALVRARFPQLSAPEVIHRLTATADDKGTPGRDEQYGYGVINIVRALTADVPPLATRTAGPTAVPTISIGVAAPPAGGGNIAWYVALAASLLILVLAMMWRLLRRRVRPT